MTHITLPRAVVEQALELLSRYHDETPLGHQPHMIAHKATEAITALRAALNEASKEPIHKLQWENYMTQDEYNSIPLGSTVHLKDSGSYQKVNGWGPHHETLLLDCQTFILHAPESLIVFKEYSHV